MSGSVCDTSVGFKTSPVLHHHPLNFLAQPLSDLEGVLLLDGREILAVGLALSLVAVSSSRLMIPLSRIKFIFTLHSFSSHTLLSALHLFFQKERGS